MERRFGLVEEWFPDPQNKPHFTLVRPILGAGTFECREEAEQTVTGFEPQHENGRIVIREIGEKKHRRKASPTRRDGRSSGRRAN